MFDSLSRVTITINNVDTSQKEKTMRYTLMELCAYSLPEDVFTKITNDYELSKVYNIQNRCCRMIANIITSDTSSQTRRNLSSGNVNELEIFLHDIFFDSYDRVQDVCLQCLQFLHNISVAANDGRLLTYDTSVSERSWERLPRSIHTYENMSDELKNIYKLWFVISKKILQYGRLECFKFLHETCQQYNCFYGIHKFCEQYICGPYVCDSCVNYALIKSGNLDCLKYAESLELLDDDFLAYNRLELCILCFYTDNYETLEYMFQLDRNMVQHLKFDMMCKYPVLRLYEKALKYGSKGGLLFLDKVGLHLDDSSGRETLKKYAYDRFVVRDDSSKIRSADSSKPAPSSRTMETLRQARLTLPWSPYELYLHKPIERLDAKRIKCLEFLQTRYGYDFDFIIKFTSNRIN